MAPSLWAQLDQQNQAQNAPPPPSVFAPTEMTGPPPQMPATPSTAPQIARMPTLGEQEIAQTRGDRDKFREEKARPWGFAGAEPSAEFPQGLAPNHNTKLGKIAHVFSNIGNIAGDIFAPAVMANIPGTQMHRDIMEQGLTGQLNKEIGDESLNQERAANQAHTEEETAAAPGKNAREEANTTSEIASRDQATDRSKNDLVNTLAHYVQADLKAGKDPNANPTIQALRQQIETAKPAATKGGEHINVMGPDGKTPMVATYDPTTKKVFDQSGKEILNPVPYEKPISIHTGDAHEFAENERGRGLLDKAEASYRQAQQSAQGMKAMIDDAQAGGKMSARVLPLQGALEITTANGVHRINRNEIEQYGGGGSAFDRLAGALKGGGEGIPYTNEILQSMKHLTDIQEKGAYDNYKGAYDSATHRYHLTDEKPMNGPAAETRQ